MILNVVTCLREFAQFLTRYALNFHTDFLTTHLVLVICEKIDVNMKTNAHIYEGKFMRFLEWDFIMTIMHIQIKFNIRKQRKHL